MLYEGQPRWIVAFLFFNGVAASLAASWIAPKLGILEDWSAVTTGLLTGLFMIPGLFLPTFLHKWRKKNFGKLFLLVMASACLIRVGLGFVVYDVLHSTLPQEVLFLLVLPLLAPVCLLGIKRWSKPGKNDPPT
jgi:hypothetical protein